MQRALMPGPPKGAYMKIDRMTREKALQYDKFRLPYSTEACEFVISLANVDKGIVADIGAGTGLLTKHFVGKAKMVYAVEPELEMRNIAIDTLGIREDIEYIDGVSENTKLPDQSIDLIVAANAYHRFQPESTNEEFRRILKPSGMLAIFSYYDDNNFFKDNMAVCQADQYINRLTVTRHDKPVQFFFGNSTPSRYLFRQQQEESWIEYWGAVVSGMESPNEGEEWFESFKKAHKKRFEEMETNGLIKVAYSTEVWIGKPDFKGI
jgi:ubiquinone/menaquinone biosynthesis C-methylase UbiE